MTISALETATALLRQKISFIPINPNKKTPALTSWKKFTDKVPDEFETAGWFDDRNPDRNIAAVGNRIQCIDFDEPELIVDFIEQCRQLGLQAVTETLIHVGTPSGGNHLIFLSDPIPNMKLAVGLGGDVMIETRGHGGYFVIPPSKCISKEDPDGDPKPYELTAGSFEDVPEVLKADRDRLLSIARSFDERTAQEERNDNKPASRQSTPSNDGSMTPLDDFDQNGDIVPVLRAAGWTPNGMNYWQRPGKKTPGISATLNQNGQGTLYVFSSNAAPFDSDRGYKPSAVYALLEHGGDFAAAARQLRKEGFGSGYSTSHSGPPKATEEQQIATVQKIRDIIEARKTGTDEFDEKSGLPVIMNPDDVKGHELNFPDQLIEGVLYQGAKMMIAGPSKARKTYTLMDLAISVASGEYWIGKKTKKSPVLFINLELQDFDFINRFRKIEVGKFGKEKTGVDVHVWNVRGYGVTLDKIAEEIIEYSKNHGIGLIVVDPVYKLSMTGEENAASDVGKLLNQFEMLCLAANVSLVFAHHFAKGNAGEKDSIDRASGSGVWARDPDVIMTMNNHANDDCMIVEMSLRNFAPVPKFVIKWIPEAHIWGVAIEESADDTKQSNGKKRQFEESAGNSGRPKKDFSEVHKAITIAARKLKIDLTKNVGKKDREALGAEVGCGETSIRTRLKKMAEEREEKAAEDYLKNNPENDAEDDL
jgi:hypothetical protein